MSPELLQGWFRIAVLIVLVSAGLLLFEPPGTAEFIITVTSLVIGLAFIAIVVFLVRRANR